MQDVLNNPDPKDKMDMEEEGNKVAGQHIICYRRESDWRS